MVACKVLLLHQPVVQRLLAVEWADRRARNTVFRAGLAQAQYAAFKSAGYYDRAAMKDKAKVKISKEKWDEAIKPYLELPVADNYRASLAVYVAV
jgi:hypothetical protein